MWWSGVKVGKFFLIEKDELGFKIMKFNRGFGYWVEIKKRLV